MKNSPRKVRGLKHNLVMLSGIIDVEISSYEEVAKKKGKETMIKEYQFKKNDF